MQNLRRGTLSSARQETSFELCSLRQRADGKAKDLTKKANKARAIGMVIGIVVLVIAVLWKRLLR